VLSNQKIEFAVKTRVPDWQQQLAGCAAEFAQAARTTN
jgi:hypothetical protein